MKKLIILTLFILLNGIKGISQEILEAGSHPEINFEDTGQYKYVLIDTNQVWGIGTVEKNILFMPGENNYSIITNNSYYYGNNTNASFQFKIVIGGYSEYVVRFEHKYDFEANKDGGIIEISHDNGANWQNILLDSIIQAGMTYVDNLYSITDTVEANKNGPGFTGLQDEKLITEFSFIYWVPYYDTILFKFTILSDSINSYNEGWILDNFFFNGILSGTDNARLDNDGLLLYPNPVVHTLNLQIQNKVICQAGIYSIMGKQILKIVNNSITHIDLQNLSPGIYFLSCQTADGETYITKFIRQ